MQPVPEGAPEKEAERLRRRAAIASSWPRGGLEKRWPIRRAKWSLQRS